MPEKEDGIYMLGFAETNRETVQAILDWLRQDAGQTFLAIVKKAAESRALAEMTRPTENMTLHEKGRYQAMREIAELESVLVQTLTDSQK